MILISLDSDKLLRQNSGIVVYRGKKKNPKGSFKNKINTNSFSES